MDSSFRWNDKVGIEMTSGIITMNVFGLLGAINSEKYAAIRRMTRANAENQVWFLVMMVSVALILSLLLVLFRRHNVEVAKQRSDKRFHLYADNKGLVTEECSILSKITERADVSQKETIFNAMAVFNRGAAKLMKERFSSGLDLEDRRRLNRRISDIREKLGFKKKSYSYGVRSRKSKGLSSRQIGVGKKLSMVLSSNKGQERVDAVVISNDDVEFVVRAEFPQLCRIGDTWSIHYHFGASIWEFDALMIDHNGDRISLNHSDNIRFINRRRFLRVEVDRPGLISLFPVFSEVVEDFSLPKFNPARITEMSGPGIRLETDLEVIDGDRVLVLFRAEAGRMVGDIGIVRGYRGGEAGSIGIELVGMGDKGVDELVRMTNNEAMKYATEERQDEPDRELAEGGVHV